MHQLSILSPVRNSAAIDGDRGIHPSEEGKKTSLGSTGDDGHPLYPPPALNLKLKKLLGPFRIPNTKTVFL